MDFDNDDIFPYEKPEESREDGAVSGGNISDTGSFDLSSFSSVSGGNSAPSGKSTKSGKKSGDVSYKTC